MTRPRTLAREAALKALYQLDLRPELELAEVDAQLVETARTDDALKFARALLEGTRAHLEAIDAELEAVAHNWSLTRMAVIDRNVLRIATYELMHCNDVPPKVAINEAIELGKRYSTQNSGAFINGILDKIMNQTGAGSSDGGADR